ncbi:MAG: radical SAM protein [Cytophagales bacterium]|nr:MAG: radical SAM protein [Cytophagales bacterium]
MNLMQKVNSISQVGSLRQIYINTFDDGSGYVFNPENPFGVKYLSKQALSLYNDMIGEYGNPPIIESPNVIEKQFIAQGLASSPNSVFELAKKPKKALTVWYHISNACNLSCQYCYIPKLMKAVDLNNMEKFFMSSETTKISTDSLFKYCLSAGITHLQMKFAGGEPTLNTDLIEQTCKYALDKSEETGVKVGFRILTNGVFINNDIYDIFKKYKFGVSISIDGDKNRHDEIRFTIPKSRVLENDEKYKKGTWDVISDNIDKLLSLGIKPYILCTVTQKNYKYLMNLVEFCVSKKIGFRLSPVRDNKTHLLPNLQEDMLQQLIRIYDWLGDNLPITMPLERFARFAEWNLLVKKQIVCGTCKSMMSIDQNGNVGSCQMRMDKVFGNVNNQTLSEIVNAIQSDESNKYIVNPNEKTQDCVTCFWRYTCAGGCPEHTRNAIGTTNSPSPWCHLYQELLPYYIRSIAKQYKRASEISK